jgi:hypothetical protein
MQAEPPLFPFAVGHERPRVRALRGGWSYAMGVCLAAVILWAAIAIVRIAPRATLASGTVAEQEMEDESGVFTVIKAKIGNEPARPMVFKPGQAGLTIVWFEKIKN